MARHAKSARVTYFEIPCGENAIYGKYVYWYMNGVDANRESKKHRATRRGYVCIWEHRSKDTDDLSGEYTHEYIWVKRKTLK